MVERITLQPGQSIIVTAVIPPENFSPPQEEALGKLRLLVAGSTAHIVNLLGRKVEDQDDFFMEKGKELVGLVKILRKTKVPKDVILNQTAEIFRGSVFDERKQDLAQVFFDYLAGIAKTLSPKKPSPK
jgi:hypothetical protein